ncbi:Mth938-like domain-containing protein [Ferrovibrio sp.]|uniref:Mth938-like domain-containing protein n=1 Tax=Ferrovibrio sp. TaxID=1917215 RepID=UPI003D1213CF
MADLKQQVAPDRQTIAAYGDGGFRIAGKHWLEPVLVQPRLTLAWPVSSLAGMSIESFAPLLAAEAKPELLVLGCGASIAPVPRDIRAALREQGIVIEPMNTGAACRTYNLLVLESRSVAAALIPV